MKITTIVEVTQVDHIDVAKNARQTVGEWIDERLAKYAAYGVSVDNTVVEEQVKSITIDVEAYIKEANSQG